jgi:phospholipid/cholesterol/gamma-HCH transport system substrate-binding protein
MNRRLIVPLAIVAMFLSGCGFQGLYSVSLPGGADVGDHPYSVTVEFGDVLDLVPQSAVKVDDVAVGKVTAISLGQNCSPKPTCPNKRAGRWVADVTIQVNASVKVPRDSRAEILQTSLLGEKYVSLEPPAGQTDSHGDPTGALLRNGDKIRITNTASPPEAEDVLGALSLLLNEGGLQQIRVIADELGKAMSGKQRQQAIHDLFGQMNTFVKTLDTQKDGIVRALENIDTLAKTLNRNRATITAALDTFPQALKVLRDQRVSLVKLLTSLANLGHVATNVIDATQTQFVRSLKELFPAVTRLTQAGDNFPQSLRILGTFPFPLGVSRQFVKGDYANLDAIVNLNLTNTLCGTVGLCAAGASNAAKKLGLPVVSSLLPGLLPQSKSSSPIKPMIVGAGK